MHLSQPSTRAMPVAQSPVVFARGELITIVGPFAKRTQFLEATARAP